MREALFRPRSLLVVGVSEKADNLGRNIVGNLMNFGFRGELHLMGRAPGVLWGHRIHTSWDEIPEGIDQALIITPAPTVPGVIEQCGRKGIRFAVIESAGFQELGAEGASVGEALREAARRIGVRFHGPNCLGMTTFAHGMCQIFVPTPNLWRVGPVAIAAQSGGMGVTYLFAMASENVGVSHFISLGNQMDLKETDFLRALEQEDSCQVISMYLEGISDGRAFFEALRTCNKPVLVQKAGTTDAGTRAAFSHTASLAANDAVLSAAIRQAGALRVHDTDEMVTLVKGFLMPPVRGDRVAIISRSGGHAVIGADCAAREGLTLPSLPPDFLEEVTRVHSSSVIRPRNPLDLGDLFQFDLYAHLMEAAAAHPEFDAVVMAHTYVADARRHQSRRLIPAAEEIVRKYQKPVFLVLVTDGQEIAYLKKKHDFPIFTSVEQAFAALGASRRSVRRKDRRASNGHWHPSPALAEAARDLSSRARNGQTRLLAEGFDLLSRAGVPVPRGRLVRSAPEIGEVSWFPVAAKVISARAVHKSDVGGVRLNLRNREELAATFKDFEDRFGPFGEAEGVLVQEMAGPGVDVLVGGVRDPLFGPLVMVGMGGVLVEVLRDTSLRLAPVTEAEAREMISDLQGKTVLEGVRGQPPADREALVRVIQHVGGLLHECPEIREIDINPLRVHPEGQGATALDVRISLDPVLPISPS